MEINQLYNFYKSCYRVTTDTRINLENSIFFALKGENFNGNKYAELALEKGANFAIVDEEAYQTNKRIILVDNCLETLQELATYHRKQLKIPIIALTGSNGKTTTKELISSVLKQKFNCIATKGNLNNHIGVPLTLLSMNEDTEIGVVEMGANHLNEIDFLCNLALPDFGYITNFGRVHLEGFGSFEGVIQGKTEMYRYLQKRDKIVFINSNDKIQMEKSFEMHRVTFGGAKADFHIRFKEANPYVEVSFNGKDLRSNLIGKYNFTNIAVAVAIGKYLEISDNQIMDAIGNYIPRNNRSQIMVKGSNQIILDAYNANPNSMEVAIENLAQLSAANKIAILGDMFEVGNTALAEHMRIIRQIENTSIGKAFLIGHFFSELEVNNPNIIQFKTFEDFKVNCNLETISDTTFLIKASRGMALERVLDLL